MEAFEQYLDQLLDNLVNSRVKEAMKYSLKAGGKRARPKLLFSCLLDYGCNEKIGYPSAAAIEMIHTYSLIHDDLPAMDNDTLRRGLPTCHIAFDEATAILAGDGLLTYAFEVATKASEDPLTTLKIINAIANYSGSSGMIYGQCLDLAAEQQNDLEIDDILQIHQYKTAKLLTLPLICAAYLANKEEDIPKWIEFGMHIGLAFQIQDDILDVTSSEEVLGKNINSDMMQEKNTYVTKKGIEQAQKDVDMHFASAYEILEQLNLQDNHILNYTKGLQKRKN